MAASTFSRYTNDRDYGAELFGAPGVGYEIINASNNLAMDASVAYMLLISLAFLCMDVGFRLFERRLLAWR
jgi:NitT/TauT family transport system permease protein